ncbi:unnamed protein product [Prunus armeniaca]|uniref:OVATE domain-containing protein n=1 Tax=Prunus armeniaca TaxID=36596 RepID=A0A6J5VKA4_PRUAR|nr:unnamed protein product [Prunus armeniaca]
MLLRNPISNTKRFFQKTLGNLKNFFSAGSYEKLPKSPPVYNNPFQYATAVDLNNLHTTSYKDLDKLYTDFTDQWDSEIEKMRRSNKKKVISTPTKLQDHHQEVQSPTSFTKLNAYHASPPPAKINKNYEKYDLKNRTVIKNRDEKTKTVTKESRELREGCLVAQKIKEMEMLDMSNVDHVLDIEEVLHYYSRLTCPAYLEIVDKFFMDVYAEFFGPAAPAAATPARSIKSRLRPRSLMMS